jgi:hypothetical protein
MPSPLISPLDLISVQVNLTDTLQVLWHNTSDKPEIAVSGTFANLSDDMDQEHLINLELEASNGTKTKIFNNVPLVFGSTMVMPKVVVPAGGKLSGHVQPSASSTLVDATISVMRV